MAPHAQARNRRRPALLTAAAATACAAVLAGLAAAATDPYAGIRAFKPIADTYVTSSRPAANFGGSGVLRVDSAPQATAYLRFRPGKLKGEIESATLLLHTSGARNASYEVRLVSANRWKERRLTYSNAPRLSLRYTASKPVRRGIWSAVDVTPFVSDEEVSLAVTTRGTRELVFGSRESKHGPRLVVRVAAEDRDGDAPEARPDVHGAEMRQPN